MSRNVSIALVAVHIVLGLSAKFAPPLVWLYSAAVIAYGAFRIVSTQDRNHCAARYGVYLMSIEVLYRMSGGGIFWELGKYGCALLFLIGIVVRGRQSNVGPFILYLCMMLPAVAFTESNEGFNAYRRMILFNLSGPICLAFSGMYFYNRNIEESHLWKIISYAVYPGFSVLALLFLGPSIAEVDLSAQSNIDLSGGFGPNQVSTALGYFLLLIFFAVWNQKVLTFHRLLDYSLAALLAYRALLTFSRGGLFAVALAIFVSFLGMMVLSNAFRKRFVKYSLILTCSAVVAGGVFYFTNQATGNWLLYRYQGLDSSEVLSGQRREGGSYLTGREQIMVEEFELFKRNWVTGVGIGMSQKLRSHSDLPAHSEPSRAMAEHGIFGLFALVLLFVILPAKRVFARQSMLSLQFFLLFFVLGANTLLHGAMRMALSGGLIGFAFAKIVKDKEK